MLSADSRHPAARLRGIDSRTVVLLAVAAAWSVAVVGSALGAITLPGPPAALVALGLGVPLALTTAAIFFAPGRVPLAGVAAWTALVAAALLAGVMIAATPLLALAVPVGAVAGLACLRRPAAAVLLGFAVSGFYGSLIAFWRVPVEQIINVAILGLIGALVAAHLFGRRPPLILWPPAIVLGIYVLITFFGIPFADDRGIALSAFSTSGLYLVLALTIAYSGWEPRVHDAIARGVLVLAALVAGYAVLRWQIGPAAPELGVAEKTPFNSVDGELKVFGSFPSAQDLGVWTAAVIPFCVACALTLRERAWRAGALAAGALCVIAMLVSQLRAGLFGAIAGTVAVVVVFQLAGGLPGVRLGTTFVAILTAVAVTVSAFALTGESANNPKHSYRSLFEEPSSDPSVNARLYKWNQAVVDLRDRPLGYGVGTASFAQQQQGRFYVSVGDFNVDNGYLKIALEQGFGVMIFFILALLAAGAGLVRGAMRAAQPRSVAYTIGAVGTLASIAAMLNAGAFIDAPRALAGWVIIGLGLAQCTRARAAGDQPLDSGP